MNYYIAKGQQVEGPYTINQLRGMWANGAITATTQFCESGVDDWQPMETIIELLEAPTQARTSPQQVHVTQVDPFAHLHTPIAGKSRGNLTFIGACGVGIGVMSWMVVVANPASVIVGVIGSLLGIASWFWARSEKASPISAVSVILTIGLIGLTAMFGLMWLGKKGNTTGIASVQTPAMGQSQEAAQMEALKAKLEGMKVEQAAESKKFWDDYKASGGLDTSPAPGAPESGR